MTNALNNLVDAWNQLSPNFYTGQCEVAFEVANTVDESAAAAELAAMQAVIEAARTVNEWLVRNTLTDTAHQRLLAAALADYDEKG